jgi:hypothetical protein
MNGVMHLRTHELELCPHATVGGLICCARAASASAVKHLHTAFSQKETQFIAT